MELMCAHFFHTECLVVHWYDNEMSCPSCHMNVFNNQVRTASTTRHQESQQKKEEKFGEEYNQSKDLRLDIKAIKKQVASTRRARGAYTKFAGSKRREWNQESKPLLDLLRVKQKEFARALQLCPQLKTWNSERAKLSRIVARFERKHTQYTFRKLQDYRFLKLPSVWDYRYLTSTSYRWRPGRYFRIRL